MTDTEERTPPRRVRIDKLQEIHIGDLKLVDQACAEMYWALGFDAAEVPVRTAADFYRLPKGHAVRVAEADYHVAGFSAFRDEAPGIAYLEEIAVHPDYQRFGIGRQLLTRVFEEARAANLDELVLRTWDKALWARAFYQSLGFAPVDGNAPPKVRAWLEDKTAGGRPFLRPGESVLWAKVPQAETAADDDEDDASSDPPAAVDDDASSG